MTYLYLYGAFINHFSCFSLSIYTKEILVPCYKCIRSVIWTSNVNMAAHSIMALQPIHVTYHPGVELLLYSHHSKVGVSCTDLSCTAATFNDIQFLRSGLATTPYIDFTSARSHYCNGSFIHGTWSTKHKGSIWSYEWSTLFTMNLFSKSLHRGYAGREINIQVLGR